MLIDKNISIKLNTKNKGYYRDLGYSFSDKDVKDGKEIFVRQTDVLHGTSKIKLEYVCDYCGKKHSMTPRNYYRARKDLELDVCDNPECKKWKKDKIKQNKYGTINYGEIAKIEGYKLGRSTRYTPIDIYNMANIKNHTILNELSEYIATKDRILLRCNVHNNEFETNIGAYMKNKDALNCPICRSEHLSDIKRKSSIEDVRKICEEKNYTLLTESINNCDDPVYYICNVHPEYGIQKTSLYGLQRYDKNCKLCHQPRGADHPNWQGGITDNRDRDNDSFEYVRWRTLVFNRDNYTCQCCGKSGDRINAHHIMNYSSHEELRYEVTNGVTLCEECHLNSYPNSFHTMYGVYNNTPEQLQEYFDMRRSELGLPLIKLDEIVNKESTSDEV